MTWKEVGYMDKCLQGIFIQGRGKLFAGFGWLLDEMLTFEEPKGSSLQCQSLLASCRTTFRANVIAEY